MRLSNGAVAILISATALLVSGYMAWNARSSLGVASSALDVSRDALDLQKEHNRVSVRPALNLSRQISFEGGDEGSLFRLKVENRGLGPANIRWSALFLNDERQSGWLRMLGNLGLEKAKHGNFYQLGRRHTLLPNDEIVLVELLDEASAHAANGNWNMGRLEIHFCYCSFYDDCWMAEWSGPTSPGYSTESCPRDRFRFDTP